MNQGKISTLKSSEDDAGHFYKAKKKAALHFANGMSDLKDIENKEDIVALVDAFYGKVKNDSLLAPVFASRIPADAWPAHLQRMYSFGSALLFGERGFDGNPMQKHLSLPIDESHFVRWQQLFYRTVDSLFKGSKADEAKRRAGSIAQIMQFKLLTHRQ